MNPLFKQKFLTAAAALFLAVTLLWTGCNDEAKSGEDGNSPADTSQTTPPTNDPATERSAILHSVPSPVQMAFYLLNSKAPYNEQLPNPTNNLDKYSNSFSQAINLGIYQADLGYLIAHGQTQQALNYLENVKTLGDKLGILNSFEKEMIERAEDNLDDRDSLFAITTDAFKDAEIYLNENARPEIADVIVIGGWLESTYLATQTLKTEGAVPLRRRIGEDKLVLPRLLSIINQYSKSEEYTRLAASLKEVSALYDQVQVKHDYKPAETDKEKRVTRITSSHKIRYSSDLLAQITDKVAELRNQYTQ
ncbi:MAG: hypothetical protein AAGN35_06110 [Bacteroidota bacterium]